MAASKPALTDTAGLVALLYRADWTRLCLSAEFSRRAEWPRTVSMEPGQDNWRPDKPDKADRRENWRLATDADADADGEPLPWRDSLSRVLLAPGRRFRIEDAAPDPAGSVVLIHDGDLLWRVGPDEALRVPALGLADGLTGLLDPSWLVGYWS
jgi:hypothetical protein